MKIIEPFIRLLRGFVALLLVFMAGKCLFMACYPAIYGPLGGREAIAPVLVYGLPMDCSMAAYFCALPLLIMTAGIWWRSPWIGRSLKAYTVIAAALMAVAFVADTALYGYWAFKLDTTALFYLTTSPAAAMASVPWWTPLCGLALVLLIGWGIYALLWRMWRPSALACAVRRSASTALMLLAAPLLVLAMRGGVTVSTMNLSSAYFSPAAPLNHAAVNPLFSFMYSATHQSHFSDQFRFYPSQQEAESIYADLLRNGGSAAQDTLPAPRHPELSISTPDIYIVILESFSSYLMPSLGGDSVAMNLDSIARSSILFTDFYASSFRTDRSLPAILSGYPAQPTTSVMKYTDKTERMPSLPRSLASLGYGLEYYYGGDANFTNMKAFLVSAGFSTIISDKDFPVSERLSKWGVHDDRLFSLLTSRIEARPASAPPMLTVIQTSSSHEPFEVPFSSSFSDPRLNAFAYTDHCVGQWINSLRADPERWRRALVIMLPDHWGVWPDNLPPGPARHRIPLIMTGGAIASPMPQRVGLTASQTDLAATVLAMLGHESDMPFSHDIFDPSLARSAFFSEPDLAALVAPTDTVVLNLATGEPSPPASPLAPAVKAYLQVLYTDLDNL